MTTPTVVADEISYVDANRIRVNEVVRELPHCYIVEMAEGGLRLKYTEVRDLGVYHNGEHMFNIILDDMNRRLSVLTKK